MNWLKAMDWLKTHVYIAAWASALISLIGMILKKPTGSVPLNWSRIMLNVTFLTCLAVAVTPGTDTVVRSMASTLVFVGVGYLIIDSGRR